MVEPQTVSFVGTRRNAVATFVLRASSPTRGARRRPFTNGFREIAKAVAGVLITKRRQLEARSTSHRLSRSRKRRSFPEAWRTGQLEPLPTFASTRRASFQACASEVIVLSRTLGLKGIAPMQHGELASSKPPLHKFPVVTPARSMIGARRSCRFSVRSPGTSVRKVRMPGRRNLATTINCWRSCLTTERGGTEGCRGKPTRVSSSPDVYGRDCGWRGRVTAVSRSCWDRSGFSSILTVGIVKPSVARASRASRKMLSLISKKGPVA